MCACQTAQSTDDVSAEQAQWRSGDLSMGQDISQGRRTAKPKDKPYMEAEPDYGEQPLGDGFAATEEM